MGVDADPRRRRTRRCPLVSARPRFRETHLRHAGQLNAPLPADEPGRCCAGCRRGIVPGQFPCGKPTCRCHQSGGANHHPRQPLIHDDDTNDYDVDSILDWLKEHA